MRKCLSGTSLNHGSILAQWYYLQSGTFSRQPTLAGLMSRVYGRCLRSPDHKHLHCEMLLSIFPDSSVLFEKIMFVLYLHVLYKVVYIFNMLVFA